MYDGVDTRIMRGVRWEFETVEFVFDCEDYLCLLGGCYRAISKFNFIRHRDPDHVRARDTEGSLAGIERAAHGGAPLDLERDVRGAEGWPSMRASRVLNTRSVGAWGGTSGQGRDVRAALSDWPSTRGSGRGRAQDGLVHASETAGGSYTTSPLRKLCTRPDSLHL